MSGSTARPWSGARALLLAGVTSLAAACGDDDGGGTGLSSMPESGSETGSVQSSMGVNCSGLTRSEEASAFEDEVLALVNQRRSSGADCGGRQMAATSPVTLNATLVCTARAHSQDMLQQDYFEHESLDGRSPADRMVDAGYDFRAMGENIAAGQSSPTAVMETWMQSSGHCRNIMDPDFVHIGIGYAAGEGRQHLWTQNFGAPL